MTLYLYKCHLTGAYKMQKQFRKLAFILNVGSDLFYHLMTLWNISTNNLILRLKHFPRWTSNVAAKLYHQEADRNLGRYCCSCCCSTSRSWTREGVQEVDRGCCTWWCCCIIQVLIFVTQAGICLEVGGVYNCPFILVFIYYAGKVRLFGVLSSCQHCTSITAYLE
jgi:hypothetical protein